MKRIVIAAASALMFSATAHAGDWTGFYAGVHGGYSAGSLHDFVDPELKPEGGFGGFQLGYDHQFENGNVVGIAADVSFGDIEDSHSDFTDLGFGMTIDRDISSEVEAFGSIRGRVGHAFGNILPYVTGGLAWTRMSADYRAAFSWAPAFDVIVDDTKTHFGWTAGIGVEAMLSEHISAFVEYAYADFSEEDYDASLGGVPYSEPIEPDFHTVKFGINYRF
jgi:outer membrane immunogenic protein